MVIQGHEHAYARTCMLYKGECVDGFSRPASFGESLSAASSSAAAASSSSSSSSRRMAAADAGGGKGFIRRAGARASSVGRRRAEGLGPGTTRQEEGKQGLDEEKKEMEVEKAAKEEDPDLPGRAPVYILAGHAGAGFTHGFPAQLPHWVVEGMQVGTLACLLARSLARSLASSERAPLTALRRTATATSASLPTSPRS